jgi:hypothetical protein
MKDLRCIPNCRCYRHDICSLESKCGMVGAMLLLIFVPMAIITAVEVSQGKMTTDSSVLGLSRRLPPLVHMTSYTGDPIAYNVVAANKNFFLPKNESPAVFCLYKSSDYFSLQSSCGACASADAHTAFDAHVCHTDGVLYFSFHAFIFRHIGHKIHLRHCDVVESFANRSDLACKLDGSYPGALMTIASSMGLFLAVMLLSAFLCHKPPSASLEQVQYHVMATAQI